MSRRPLNFLNVNSDCQQWSCQKSQTWRLSVSFCFKNEAVTEVQKLTAANNQSTIQTMLDKVRGLLLLLKGRVNSNSEPKEREEHSSHTHAYNWNSHVAATYENSKLSKLKCILKVHSKDSQLTLIPWLHQVVMNPNNRVKRCVQRKALGKSICPIFWI